MDMNVKNKTLWGQGEIWGNLGYLGLDNEFLNLTPKTQFTKRKLDKLNFIKIKNFCFMISSD